MYLQYSDCWLLKAGLPAASKIMGALESKLGIEGTLQIHGLHQNLGKGCIKPLFEGCVLGLITFLMIYIIYNIHSDLKIMTK